MPLPRAIKRRLGTLLIAEGLVDEEQVQHALDEQKRTGKPLGQIFVELDYISEEQLVRTLAEQLQVPYIDPSVYNIEPELIKMVPADLMHRYQFVPLDRFGNIVIIAAAGMPDERVASFFKEALDCDVMLYICTYTAARVVLQKYAPLSKEQEEAVIEKRKSDALHISERLHAESSARMQKVKATEERAVPESEKREPVATETGHEPEEPVPVTVERNRIPPPPPPPPSQPPSPREEEMVKEMATEELAVPNAGSSDINWQSLFDEMDAKIREEVKKRKDLRKRGLL